MTSKLRALALVVPAALAIALTGCTGSPSGATTQPTADPSETVTTEVGLVVHTPCHGDEGVTVVVDTGSLEVGSDPSQVACVITDEPIRAADALLFAHIETQGTKDYPDQIVCRVDGVPSEDTALTADDGTVAYETCASMPPAFAYWSLWVRPAGGEWGYAEEGLSTLELEPGESLQLLFVLNDEPAAPAP
ncbi:hypothetical protein [Microbacterium ulmi]|uniref:Uncharacterized protein n=1 Tax=Microbacterium ulmi TaxID=179095 RepID=A0A7Y2M0J6_9MICO|nr:hypothetical protein [Microbacterium ulmi]NII68779.1 hypothetical protein [Microbacterium ulmi]NNH03564.1 hypothetical protein [Microbacterium ulmi]